MTKPLKQKLAIAIVVSALTMAGCDDDGPTTPTPTRIVALSGNLNFGNVVIGSSAERTLTIGNSGNSALSLTGITVPSGYSTNFVAATVQAGSSLAVTVRLTPTEPREYSGIVAVTGDQTSGTNTASITGTGVVAAVPVSRR